MNFYTSIARPLAFRLEPERAHSLALAAGGWVGRAAPGVLRGLYGFESSRLATRVAGLALANPLGLPAGFDKNGVAIEAAAAIGFGAIEIGSVSLNPSAGNRERPRLYRVPADEALMVYYGVPNEGAQAVAARLRAAPRAAPIGVSLVETNTGVTEPADAVIEELVGAARILAPHVDFISLNLNCPNSLAGESVFEDPRVLRALFDGLATIAALPPVIAKAKTPRGAPDIDAVLAAAEGFDFIRGFVPNPMVPKPYTGLRTPAAALAAMRGTLSGPFRRALVVASVGEWYARIDPGRHVLFGVGGVRTAEEAYALVRAGASLVQVLTAFVYHGPALASTIKRGLDALLARDGFGSVGEAVGVDVRRAPA